MGYTVAVRGKSHVIDQGLTNSSCSVPDGKYFRLVGHVVSVTTAQLCPCGMKAARDNTETSGWGCHSKV